MRPTARLLGALLALALLAVASAFSGWLAGPAWACLAVVLGLFVLDLRLTLREAPVQVVCELPARCRLGEPFNVKYELHNPTRRTLAVWLIDDRGPALGGDLALGPLALAASSSISLERAWTARGRGLFALGPIHGLSRSLLGTFERRFEARAAASELAVLPNAGPGSGRALGPDAAPGARPRRARGEGMELDALRRFTQGDDPRHVDWRASARAGQLIVRTFRDERKQSLVMAVDCGRMMAAEVEGLSKLDHALNSAVALARAALAHGDRVGFAAFDAAVRSWVPVGDPRRGMALLLEATLPLAPSTRESSFRILTELLEAQQRKRSLVVILSDFVETADALQLEGYLARLARRHVVLLVALRDVALSELDEPRPALDEAEIYRRLVLQDLAAERRLVLRRLDALGVHTLDVRPEQSRGPLLSQYLELRRAL
jgi:uncharacterized protein (DUF58 family)